MHRRFRALLRLPPLSLTAAQAAEFSGHSARHFGVCFATAVAAAFSPPRYSKDELAMLGDWQEGMVSLYSTEALVPRKMELLTRLLQDVEAVLGYATEHGVELLIGATFPLVGPIWVNRPADPPGCEGLLITLCLQLRSEPEG